MAYLNLLILGQVRLEKSGGGRVGRPGAKAKALLAFLATQPNGRGDRDTLAGLLWDCRSQAEARHSLRQALLTLRAQLGEYADVILDSDRDTIGLRLEAIDIDLLQFERAIRSENSSFLVETLRLWRGPFCDSLDVGAEPFEEWLLLQRARLDDLAGTWFRRVAEAQLSTGRFELAVSAAQQYVALNPFDDGAHAMLIDLYQRRGWTGPARAAYRRCVELFRVELGETPDEIVEKALNRGQEPKHEGTSGKTSGEIREMVGLPSPLDPGRRRSIANHVPVFARYANAMTVTIAVTLLAGIAASVFVLSDTAPPVGVPVTHTRNIVAWVVASEANAPAKEEFVVLPTNSTETSAITNYRDISVEEKISRALSLDPEYAHLYPSGC